MCGFIGNFGCKKNHIKNQLKKIDHRGPDHTSINYNENWNVEFCRLSINDLSSAGNQPFKIDQITIFVNGEIYNSHFLKKKYFQNTKFISSSDSEIIPHMYKKFGINFVDYLDGMFSIVIIDDEKNKLYLIKDSFGKKPLYYTQNFECNCILFCSEARLNNQSEELDDKNLITLLFCQFKFFDQTVFKNIKSIPPGNYLEFSNNKIKIVSWYKPKIKKITKETIEKNFNYLFENSIKKRLMSDVKVGIFLSGGIDSNLIARVLKKQNVKNIATFTTIIDKKISLEKTETDTYESIKTNLKDLNYENFFINIDYKYLNNNLVKIISEADQPIIETSYIVAYSCAEKAKQLDRKVVLTGLGADECFGGYPWQVRYKKNLFLTNWIIKKVHKFNKFLLNSKNKFINYIFFPSFMHNSSLGQQYWKSPDLNFLIDAKSNTFNSTTQYTLLNKQVLEHDFKNFLDYINIYGIINNQVTIWDMACMKNSIENRSPFLDKEFFEFCLSIPSKYKLKNKQLLRELGKNYCSDEILNKKKSGPTINYAVFFENKIILENTKRFILNNIYIIKNFISIKLSKKIEDSFELLLKENFMPLMSIVKVIIWIKFNIEKSINQNITFEELIKLK